MTAGLMRLRRLLCRGRLVQDRAGMAAVEFALLLPVFLTLFIGSYEVSDVLLTYLKLEAAAETAADLVAQTGSTDGANQNGILQASDFTNITNAVQQVMTPLSTTNMKIAYASVVYKGVAANGTAQAQIDWHVESNSATPITLATLPNGVSTTTMGTASASSKDSIIVVQVSYPYTSAFAGYLNFNTTLSEGAYNRPRYVTCVPTSSSTLC